MSKKKDNLVPRYTLADMLMHWAVALGFILLIVSGYIIFFDNYALMLNNTVGNVLRVIHRVGAILFVGAPIIYFIFSKNRWAWLASFRYNKSDLVWFTKAAKYYFTGKGDMPPVGKYNAGQKAYYNFAVIFGLILALSGIVIWFDLFSAGAGVVALFIHGLSALILGLFFFVHVYLSAIHPSARSAFNSMVTGYMDEDTAKEAHDQWYEEVKAEEKKKKEKDDEIA